jgi:hypothetical protein
MASTWKDLWEIPHERAPSGVSEKEWEHKGFSSTKFIVLVIECGHQFVRQVHPVAEHPGHLF